MKKIILFWCVLLTQSFLASIRVSASQKLIVSVPVADLRSEAKAAPDGLTGPALSKDIGGQNSQVLFGEKLILNKSYLGILQTGEWLNVYALDQEVLTAENKWIGCPGSVQADQVISIQNFPKYNVVLQDMWTTVYSKKDALSQPLILLACGTMLEAKKVDKDWWQVYFLGEVFGFIKADSSVYELTLQVKETEKEIRDKIVDIAKKFIGSPYVWGGRTPILQKELQLSNELPLAGQITGIDCSDFINIIFKAVGLQVPKNTSSQFYGASKLIEHGKDLRAGDLIFFTRKDDISRMCHVMLYIGKNEHGNGEVIESTGLGVSSVQQAKDAKIDLKRLGVRIIKLLDYIKVDVDQIESGKTVYKKRGYFVLMGSYLNSKEDIQKLRDKTLCLD